MEITNKLYNWLSDNLIAFEELGNRVIDTQIGKMMELSVEGDIISTRDGSMDLNVDYNVAEQIMDRSIDYIVYEFGEKFYYTDVKFQCGAQLNELKYIGVAEGFVPKEEKERVFLGLHGRYERMNGTRNYSHWCKKAKFLQINTLGIVEKNTLSGTLPFQLACAKSGIDAIIGLTIELINKTGMRYDVKLYCVNEKGWQNLLHLNLEQSKTDGHILDESYILNYGEGLVIALPPGKYLTKTLISKFKDSFDKALFQFNTLEYRSESVDAEALKNLQTYLREYRELIQPIIINDAYVLDHDDVHITQILNEQGGGKHGSALKNHYFKSFEESEIELEDLFDEADDRIDDLIEDSFDEVLWMKENCKFNINTSKLYLPVYEMTPEEKEKYGTTSNMFDCLIEDGLWKRYGEEISESHHGDQFHDELRERIAKELDVITRGGFIDYFLILWDVVEWCKTERIQVGPGRGSAAGCVISYLLDIVKIDPLQFGLIFERFLNESRIKSEMPDIDLDFASDRRDEVIEYMRDRYGRDFVCRVGTYGTLQTKGVIKELVRNYGIEGDYNINIITKLLEASENNWEPIFEDAIEHKIVKSFIQDNGNLINDAKIALNSIKSTSMHACATIIFPKLKDQDGNILNIFKQVPVRIDESGMLISEWEGEIMASAGFLKEDILSTVQMAKIGRMIDVIEERTGKRIDTQDIPLDDPNVYDLFQKGLNQDVFHFGSKKLTKYLKDVCPKNIEDLIASIALYRPGAMASNAHTDFVELRRGEKEPVYDFQLKTVTETTLGLYIYQEQIMNAAQVLGEFSLTDADGVRKAMGKKIKSKMDGYKVQFVKEAINKGCEESVAIGIWDKMEVFSGYGFNKSHAAAYSVIGYYCNWFKYYYPLEFWTTAFFYDKKGVHTVDYINEINKSDSEVSVQSPDINKSELKFFSEEETKRIYCSLTQIKFVGEGAAQKILDDRAKNGKFFTMEEFFTRVEGGAVNKRVVEHLILAGCFDEMYGIEHNLPDRFSAIRDYYELRKDALPETFEKNRTVDHFWSIRQSEVSQLSTMNYDKLLATSIFSDISHNYVTGEQFNKMKFEGKERKSKIIAGTIQELKFRMTKNKSEYCTFQVLHDDEAMQVRVWGGELEAEDDSRFEGLRNALAEAEGRIAILRGYVSYNDFGSMKCNEMCLSVRLKGESWQIF